ncbi:hypothetical protein GCM10011491_43100 [Brucella endophytica]|uniref:Uncharacterized protein n=1 Tax=Brucella endophytica TaxID=1963359 RepID=A0A916SS01_9HYPH|nr:hypothetical protein [Brucella endophytica]GGB10556.1 hypothetical protein GCM10011491_43100 [Brucella endophytica]
MLSEDELFLNFVETIGKKLSISAEDVDGVFRYIGGVNGVVSERLFISAYESLGWFIAEKLNMEQLKDFIKKNRRMLGQHSDARYFFVQALMDKSGVQGEDLTEILNDVPPEYKIYLIKRFLN